MIWSSDCAELSAVATIWRWFGVSSVPARTSSMPVTPTIGVRISWLIAARNPDFARLAPSAASCARRSSAVRSRTRCSSSLAAASTSSRARLRSAAIAHRTSDDVATAALNAARTMRLWVSSDSANGPCPANVALPATPATSAFTIVPTSGSPRSPTHSSAGMTRKASGSVCANTTSASASDTATGATACRHDVTDRSGPAPRRLTISNSSGTMSSAPAKSPVHHVNHVSQALAVSSRNGRIVAVPSVAPIGVATAQAPSSTTTLRSRPSEGEKAPKRRIATIRSGLTVETRPLARDSSNATPRSSSAATPPMTIPPAIRGPPSATATMPIPIAGQTADAWVFVETEPSQYPNDAALQYAAVTIVVHHSQRNPPRRVSGRTTSIAGTAQVSQHGDGTVG